MQIHADKKLPVISERMVMVIGQEGAYTSYDIMISRILVSLCEGICPTQMPTFLE